MRLKADIQALVDSTVSDFLDTGLRRRDETFFDSRLSVLPNHRAGPMVMIIRRIDPHADQSP